MKRTGIIKNKMPYYEIIGILMDRLNIKINKKDFNTKLEPILNDIKDIKKNILDIRSVHFKFQETKEFESLYCFDAITYKTIGRVFFNVLYSFNPSEYLDSLKQRIYKDGIIIDDLNKEFEIVVNKINYIHNDSIQFIMDIVPKNSPELENLVNFNYPREILESSNTNEKYTGSFHWFIRLNSISKYLYSSFKIKYISYIRKSHINELLLKEIIADKFKYSNADLKGIYEATAELEDGTKTLLLLMLKDDNKSEYVIFNINHILITGDDCK